MEGKECALIAPVCLLGSDKITPVTPVGLASGMPHDVSCASLTTWLYREHNSFPPTLDLLLRVRHVKSVKIVRPSPKRFEVVPFSQPLEFVG